MFVEQARSPVCSVQLDKRQPVCGKIMFRLGSAANYAWVCPDCDQISTDRAVDIPDAD